MRRPHIKPLIVGIACLTALVGCNTGFQDPFQPLPIGKKVFIAPAMVNQMPLVAGTDTSRPHSALFKIESFRGTGHSQKLASIQLTDKYGYSVKRSMAEIAAANSSPNCLSGKNDVRDLMAIHSNLILLCDAALARAFQKSIRAVVITDDNKTYELTGWASTWSDLGGSESVVIYSVSI